MTPELWKRVDPVLDKVLHLDEAGRAAYLQQLQQTDSEVAGEVADLLQLHDQSTSRYELDSPPDEVWQPLETYSQEGGAQRPNRIGPFDIDAEIGRGGMGQIFRGRDADFGRTLAIKVLLPGHQDKPEMVARFFMEAQITGQLQHPGIPPVHALSKAEDTTPYLAMKLIEGRTLAELLHERDGDKDSSTSLPRLVSIFEQVCQTLAFAHSQNVIHRDLKPGNIMVGAFGEVQVMDWGLAKRLTGERAERRPLSDIGEVAVPGDMGTHAGAVMGTLSYMPSEQASGRIDQLDERCDVFSLGAILCTLLTGHPPYWPSASELQQELSQDAESSNAKNRHAAMCRITLRKAQQGDLAEAWTRLDACGADDELIALAKQCLAADKEKRPRHAGELARAVATYQAHVQARLRHAETERAAAEARAVEESKRRHVEQAKAEEERGRRLAERQKQRRTIALFVAVTLLFLVAGTAFLWYQHVRTEQARDLVRRATHLNQSVEKLLKEALAAHVVLHKRLADEKQAQQMLSKIAIWEQLVQSAHDAFHQAKRVISDDHALLRQDVRTRLKDVARKLATDKSHWELVKELDRIRLEASFVVNGKLITAAAGPRYDAAFRDLGLNVRTGTVQDLATQIRRLPIQHALTAALDHWAHFEEEQPLGTRLLEIARHADPNPAHTPLRTFQKAVSHERLQQLARDISADQLSPQSLHLLAARLNRRGLDAVPLLRRALFHHPGDFYLLAMLGQVSKNPQEQVARFQAALVVRPKNSGVWYSLGAALLKQNNLKGAALAFEKAGIFASRYADAWVARGVVFLHQKKPKKAVSALRRALAINPKNADTWYTLSVAYHRLKDSENMIAACQKAISLRPRFVNAHITLGVGLHRQHKLQESINVYQKVIALDPENNTVWYNLGWVLSDQENLTEAAAAFEKAVVLAPKYAKAWYSLGNIRYRLKNYNAAITAYKKTLALHGEDIKTWNEFGHALYYSNNLKGAIMAYRRTVKLNPQFAEGWYNLGYTLHDVKNFKEAAAAYHKAVTINPHYSEAWFKLAWLLHEQKNLPGAIRAYQKTIAIDPKYPHAHNNLGLVFRDQKEYQKAIDAFHAEINLNRQHILAWNNLGLVWKVKGDRKKAIKVFRQAIAVNAKHPEFHYHLGGMLLEDGQWLDARKALQQALQLWPKKHHLRKICTDQLKKCEQLLRENCRPAILREKKICIFQIESVSIDQHPENIDREFTGFVTFAKFAVFVMFTEFYL